MRCVVVVHVDDTALMRETLLDAEDVVSSALVYAGIKCSFGNHSFSAGQPPLDQLRCPSSSAAQINANYYLGELAKMQRREHNGSAIFRIAIVSVSVATATECQSESLTVAVSG